MENIQGDSFKVGQRVYCLVSGWGEVTEVYYSGIYPVQVQFDSGAGDSFTQDGRIRSNANRTLFFKEPTLNIPEDCYKSPEFTYSVGQIFSYGNREYMLSNGSVYDRVNLIQVSPTKDEYIRGARWTDEIEVKDPYKITQKEFKELVGSRIGKFVLLDK